MSNRYHLYTDKLKVKRKTCQLLPAHSVSFAYLQEKGGCLAQTYPPLLAKLTLLNPLRFSWLPVTCIFKEKKYINVKSKNFTLHGIFRMHTFKKMC